MATKGFSQIDRSSGVTCDLAIYCSGLTVGLGSVTGFDAGVGALGGVTSLAVSLLASTTRVLFCSCCCIPDEAFVISNGSNIVTKLNVDNGLIGGTCSLSDIFVCRLDSGCNSLEVLGSLSGLTDNLGSTGVITKNVPVVGDKSIGATDRIVILWAGTNASSMAAGVGTVVPDQVVTFTTGATAVAGGSSAAMYVLGLLR